MLDKMEKGEKSRKITVRLNLPFAFMVLWLLGLYVMFMKAAMEKQHGFTLQAVVVFAVFFLPPCIFAYMAGFYNGAEGEKPEEGSN